MKKLLSIVGLTLALAACGSSSANVGSKWTWAQTGTGESGEPISEVNLVNAEGEILSTTTCTGVVSVLAPDGSPTMIRCWWAGGGTDYGLLLEDGVPVPHTRTIDEESGEGEWEEMN